MGERRIHFRIESDLDQVPLIGMVANKLCSLAGFDEMQTYQIELCLVEAVTNSIEHAYEGKPGLPVEVDFILQRDRFRFTVRDYGRAMAHDELNRDISEIFKDNTECAICELSSSGRGLAIIQAIMDAVFYSSTGECNVLVLEKLLAPDESEYCGDSA